MRKLVAHYSAGTLSTVALAAYTLKRTGPLGIETATTQRSQIPQRRDEILIDPTCRTIGDPVLAELFANWLPHTLEHDRTTSTFEGKPDTAC